jgi:hypothetical protein
MSVWKDIYERQLCSSKLSPSLIQLTPVPLGPSVLMNIRSLHGEGIYLRSTIADLHYPLHALSTTSCTIAYLQFLQRCDKRKIGCKHPTKCLIKRGHGQWSIRMEGKDGTTIMIRVCSISYTFRRGDKSKRVRLYQL